MTRQWPKRRLPALLCAAMVLFAAVLGAPVPAQAETAAERYARLQEELAAIRGQIEDYKDDLAQKRLLMQKYEEEKAVIDEMVTVNQEEIARTNTELDQKQGEAAVLRQTIYQSDQLLQKRLIALYNMGNASVLSQLLNIDTFSEMFTAMDAMRRISQNDTDLLESLSAQRAQLEAEQEEIDMLLAQLGVYHEELVKLQEELAANIMALDASISSTEALLRAKRQVEGDTAAAAEAAYQEMQRIAASIAGSASSSSSSAFVGGRFVWPVPASYSISCEFGQPDPNGKAHRGLDVRAPAGTTIVACGAGTVIISSYSASSYGNYIVVDHGGGITTLYAHCTSLNVGVGAPVSAGQPIATVGSTGFSTGNHLHLEVQNNGALENPRGWLQG